ncbi:MAG: hypothetical protein CMN76_14400 [Spirochaetaceae bacterium]|nr:hypothetical protein [Spirochaetaceae bacterium]|tara:strand:- start:132581 stop:133045 length:465 start_codon:yes stop_codon:yes gene_type:complete
MGQPPSFLGVTLGEPRETVQATMEESFPEAEDPAVLEDKKTTMVIYKDLSDDYRKLTLHFHPNGRLTGLNLQTALEKEELLLELLPEYGSPTRPTKRGYIWKLENKYQISITVFVKGESDLKLSDRAAYDKWGRPWLNEKDDRTDEQSDSDSGS